VTVRINGNLAEVDFASFDLAQYELFLRAKKLPESQISYDWEADSYRLTTPARFAPLLGIRPDGRGRPRKVLPIAEHLFDYQAWAVDLALQAERFALWLDTGLGKTAVLLEWTRHVLHRTSGKVLIICPIGLFRQHIGESERFYGPGLPIQRLDTRDALAAWCMAPGSGIGITNYEKFIPDVLPELRHLTGLVADESSILKTGGGKIKWNLIKSARGIPYKLSCTATPAPNEAMEYASQAAFLEKLRTEGEILWTYFTKTDEGYVIKPHARKAFYAFMASWSLYMRDPARFGFADILSTLPPAEHHEYTLAITDEQREIREGVLAGQADAGMFDDDRLGVKERARLAQAARGFLYERVPGASRKALRVPSKKPRAVAELADADIRDGRQALIWTVFDEEGEVIWEELESVQGRRMRAAILTGSQSEQQRADILDRFRRGDLETVISKPQLMGYGLNLQHVRSMVFSGIDDSFERRYQAERRAVRFGQTETVRVHEPYIPELEGMMFSNVARKEQRFVDDVALQERFYREALASSLKGAVA
jgi:hypothetical protein